MPHQSRHDDMSEGDPYQTTPRLTRRAGEPVEAFETREALLLLHRRIDRLFAIIAQGNGTRDEIAATASRIEGKVDGALAQVGMLDRRTGEDGGHSQRIRLIENKQAGTDAKIVTAGALMGAGAGWLASFVSHWK